MKPLKPAEVREMTTDEITARIDGFQEELFNLRFRRATIELEDPSVLRTFRRNIARLKTVLREREQGVSR
jgi:large subunit ribosomal protein L29